MVTIPNEMAAKPLDGITVLDFSHALAGPFCTYVLGDFGARIIKIERPGIGDDTRHVGMTEKRSDPVQGGEAYLGINKNKESVALDLSSDKGRDIALKLAERCDIVISNFRPGVMERLGLGYEQIKAVRPNTIYCEITGFGEGPRAQEVGMDIVVQARAGTIACTGEPGGPPIKPGVSLADMSGSLHAIIGILLALRARDLTGKGQKVSISLYDSTLMMLSQYVPPILNSGFDLKPMGSTHPELVPCQAYATKDSWIFIAVGSDALWRRFCTALELLDIVEDPRFNSNTARSKNKRELDLILNQKFGAKTTGQWEEILRSAKVPVSPIVTPRNAFLQALEEKAQIVDTIEHPRYGTIHLPGRAIHLSDTPGATSSYPPRLGEHTNKVLQDILKMTEEEVAGLEREGVTNQYRDNAEI